MKPLWSSAEAIKATGGICPIDWKATGVSIDTRTLQPGDLFVALTDLRDGHDFVAQALEKGAAAALVSLRPEGTPNDAPLLLVPDVLEALENLARARRAVSQARIAAVTGSVGKTSTKDMLKTILTGQGKTHVAEKSYNNQWGVPLTLARMPLDAEYAVIEIGMNHPGEIAPLAAMARPHVALITNVAAVHLEAFSSVTDIAHEKAAIFSGVEPDGAAVVNGDLPVTDVLVNSAKEADLATTLFGFGPDVDFRIDKTWIEGGATSVFSCLQTQGQKDQEFLFKLGCEGRHFAMNAVGALAVSNALGADLAIAACDLAQWQPPAGRGTRETVVLDVVADDMIISLINDAFNANPMSMGASLDVLSEAQPTARAHGHGMGRKIAILGDMLELGVDEKQMHRDIAELPALEGVDVIHCVGPLMRELYDVLPLAKRGDWISDADELMAQVAGLVGAGDVVLIKGSKGSHVSRAVDAIRKLGQVPGEQVKGPN